MQLLSNLFGGTIEAAELPSGFARHGSLNEALLPVYPFVQRD